MWETWKPYDHFKSLSSYWIRTHFASILIASIPIPGNQTQPFLYTNTYFCAGFEIFVAVIEQATWWDIMPLKSGRFSLMPKVRELSQASSQVCKKLSASKRNHMWNSAEKARRQAGRSVILFYFLYLFGIVRLRTKGHGVCFFVCSPWSQMLILLQYSLCTQIFHR
jgi:hypothetical protein